MLIDELCEKFLASEDYAMDAPGAPIRERWTAILEYVPEARDQNLYLNHQATFERGLNEQVSGKELQAYIDFFFLRIQFFHVLLHYNPNLEDLSVQEMARSENAAMVLLSRAAVTKGFRRRERGKETTRILTPRSGFVDSKGYPVTIH